MSTKKVTVTHEGWLLFCSIWVEQRDMNVWPKYRLALLLDLCVGLQQLFGLILSYFGYEPMFVMKVWPIPRGRQFEMEVHHDR